LNTNHFDDYRYENQTVNRRVDKSKLTKLKKAVTDFDPSARQPDTDSIPETFDLSADSILLRQK
jgi:hypothetical protein